MSSRVSGKPLVVPARVETSKPFKLLLDEVRQAQRTPPGLQPKKPVTSAPARPAPAVAASSTTSVGQAAPAVARARVEAEARRLGDVRAHHAATVEQAVTTRAQGALAAQEATSTRTQHVEQTETASATRAVDAIVRELVNEFETRSGGAASPKVGNPLQPISASNEVPFSVSQAAAPQAQKPEVRAAQAAALIERIDVFVRSQRPALALTLNNSLGARVEIEKLGPGRIALRLVGQNGPPSPDTVSRIREELKARGLTVGALSVA